VGSDFFLFDKNWVRTYNEEISVSYPLKTGIQCSIKATEFLKVLRKMKGEEISLEKEDNCLRMSEEGNSTVLEMNILEDKISSFIDSLFLEKVEWKGLPKDFINGLEKCMFSISDDVSLGILTGIFIDGKNLISTDNYRASWFKLKKEMGSFIIPLSSVKEIVKLKDLEGYGGNETWIHFKSSNGAVFSSRLLTGDYPSDRIKELFDFKEAKKYKFPKGLSEMLDKAEILAYENFGSFSFVSLFLEKNNLMIKGEKEFGRIKNKIKTEKESLPDGFKIDISPQFLKSVLKETDEFYHNENMLVFDRENFKHIIATVKT